MSDELCIVGLDMHAIPTVHQDGSEVSSPVYAVLSLHTPIHLPMQLIEMSLWCCSYASIMLSSCGIASCVDNN